MKTQTTLANVVVADIVTMNGYLHLIDGVSDTSLACPRLLTVPMAINSYLDKPFSSWARDCPVIFTKIFFLTILMSSEQCWCTRVRAYFWRKAENNVSSFYWSSSTTFILYLYRTYKIKLYLPQGTISSSSISPQELWLHRNVVATVIKFIYITPDRPSYYPDSKPHMISIHSHIIAFINNGNTKMVSLGVGRGKWFTIALQRHFFYFAYICVCLSASFDVF